MNGRYQFISGGGRRFRSLRRFLSCAVALAAFGAAAVELPRAVLDLPPGEGNPRNSEGDFVRLKDGRILFVYSHYQKGMGGDHDPAMLASRVSSDGGFTWSSRSEEVIANEGGMNVMSVSLLRLREGPLALFYLLKNSKEDCRPVMRLSTDEGRTWGPRTICVPDAEKGYYVLNNCRAEQLKSGRLILPLCLHAAKNGRTSDWAGKLVCFLSDDAGKTWRRNRNEPFATFDGAGRRVTTQEPGIVELKDGRLLMYARTQHGRQWFFYSYDQGETWSRGEPGSLWGPCGPATVKRLRNGDLVAIWNDHEFRPDLAASDAKNGRRVPLTVAISKDEGRTWPLRRTLESDEKNGWYCYIAAMELDKRLLLGYCAFQGLKFSRVTSVPLEWIYAAPPLDENARRAGMDPLSRFLCDGGTPAVSPDGRKVAFVRYALKTPSPDAYEAGVLKLGLYDLATKNVTWIEEGPGMAAYPTFLPNGDLVYTYGNDTETSFEAVKRQSSVGYHLRRYANGVKTDLTSGRVRDYTAVAAPDGKTLYYATTRWVKRTSKSFSTASTSMIGALDLMSGESRLVVDSPNGFNSGVVNPTVSPDGRFLVWGQLDNFFGYWRLYGAKLSDTSREASAPFTPEGLTALSPRYHPNGRYVAFAGFARGDAGWGVWILDVQTGFVKRLCDGENPAFSPEGKAIVYDLNRKIYCRPFRADDVPTAPFAGAVTKPLPPETLLASWQGPWTTQTAFPLDPAKFAFGDETPFFVRVRIKTDGQTGLRFFVAAEYAESKLGIQLYRNHDAWFATRQASGKFTGVQGPALSKGEHLLTGVRARGKLYISLDGDFARQADCSAPLALDHPERLVVARGLHKGESVLSVEVGTGWPKNLKTARTREEVLK